MNDDIRVVELFAGVGGFRIGLENASRRYRTVWADQWEPGKKIQHAFICYDSHYSGTGSVNVNEDISLVKEQVPEHELLVGGFPCQDYSVASTGAKGIEGKKGVLWWHIRDIVEMRHPKYVLLENVDRLLKSPAKQRGRDFGVILRCMADLGYSVEWRVVNAADYGCVQRRRRIFIFCSRNDSDHYKEIDNQEKEEVLTKTGFFARCFPVKKNFVKGRVARYTIKDRKDLSTLQKISDNFHAAFYSSGIMTGYEVYTRETEPNYDGPVKTLSDIMERETDTKYEIKDVEKWEYMKGSKKIERTSKNGHQYLYSEGKIPFPDPIDRPGRTMLTSEASKNRSTHVITDKTTGNLRTLTPIECERMNGFPDGWTDTMTDSMRYFTMGNALVVDLIERMGMQIIDMERQK